MLAVLIKYLILREILRFQEVECSGYDHPGFEAALLITTRFHVREDRYLIISSY
jgi:hypothetical protein